MTVCTASFPLISGLVGVGWVGARLASAWGSVDLGEHGQDSFAAAPVHDGARPRRLREAPGRIEKKASQRGRERLGSRLREPTQRLEERTRPDERMLVGGDRADQRRQTHEGELPYRASARRDGYIGPRHKLRHSGRVAFDPNARSTLCGLAAYGFGVEVARTHRHHHLERFYADAFDGREDEARRVVGITPSERDQNVAPHGRNVALPGGPIPKLAPQ